MWKSAPAKFRELLQRETASVVPLAIDPISAKMAAQAGFEALYLGGGTLGYSKTWTEANLSVTQLAQTALEMRAATELPIILDGQCGWGDPMHMHHAMAVAEAAGTAAIEIEDQIMPKRAHHHVGIEHLVPAEFMVEKIKAAVAVRRDPDFVIIGRTNADRPDDVNEALRRAEIYKRAGADMLFVLLRNPDHAAIIAERIEGPHMYMTPRGVSGLSLQDLGALGYKLVVDALTPFFAAQRALRACYAAMAQGLPDPTVGTDLSGEIDAIHDVIGLEALLEVERRTVERPD